MIHIPQSGFNLPSLAVEEFLRSLELICGRDGVDAALRLPGLEAWIDAYPAPDPDKPIDFAQLSSLLGALEQLYGPRSGRGLARRASWATFDQINQASDQVTSVKEHVDSFSFTFHRCAICWGRETESAACTANVGFLERALQWGTGEHEYSITETQCIAQGHDVCEMQILKEPLS